MILKTFALVCSVSVFVTACGGDVVAPTSAALAGTWSTTAKSIQPRGSFTKKLIFMGADQYGSIWELRGSYATVPDDSVVSYEKDYGTYSLTGNTLRLNQDSAKGWDLLSGSWIRRGKPMYIEGAPTDPVIELGPSHLVLQFAVDPGDGNYQPVKEVYYRR